MMKIQIKPLSVNEAYRGRRFKTKEYKHYKDNLIFLLPRLKIPDGKLELTLVFGFSSKGSDIDNCIKNFTDVLQEVYAFNDNRIYKLNVEKVDVEKGEEYISFSLVEKPQNTI